MEMQQIKELALANGFKLKEQASGNMDLNAYVYDFANAIEQATKASAVPYESCSVKSHEIIINETKSELIDSYDIAKEDEHLLESLVYRGVCIGKAQSSAVPATLENDCMIDQTWFMKGSSISALIKHAEDVYKAEAVAQNSKIEFGTDDNKHWFAHDVPFYGRVQIDRIEEHGLVEWDIYFNECWQGPFDSKSECIKHLEECIAEQHEEARDQPDAQ